MKTRLLICSILLVAALAGGDRQPNFVLIFADDLGYGDLASYGHPSHQTPHLDRMAAQGVRFTDFYVPMPYCAPSRAALMTGRYPFRSGVVRNPSPDVGANDIHLPLDEITIAEGLKPLGYATGAIGKWHLGHVPEYLPVKQGFDEYYGILYSNDMRPVQLVEGEDVVEYPVVQAMLTRRYTERALDFIERHRQRPFFLYLAHAMPHKPLAASEDFYTPETPDDLYADVIRELDWSVGQVLARLKELGLDDNTLVIFLSDNGPYYGGSASSGGLRGMKSRTWDGGIRVPMIARWPGRISGGRVSKQVAASVDLFPTLVKLAGGSPPAGRVIDGTDISALLTSGDAQSPHDGIFAMLGPQLRIIRSGKWKLHVRSPGAFTRYQEDVSGWVDPRGPDGVTIIAPIEQAKPNQHPGILTGDTARDMMLFDMEADPAEQHDVAARHPAVVERLKDIFDKIDADVPRVPRRPRGSPPRIKRLKGGDL
ncbi:MAG: sulfatase, partial [bacterium]|nr:sulfatase [bacterium]